MQVIISILLRNRSICALIACLSRPSSAGSCTWARHRAKYIQRRLHLKLEMHEFEAMHLKVQMSNMKCNLIESAKLQMAWPKAPHLLEEV